MKIYENNKFLILNIILPIILAFFVESYITLIENSDLLFKFSYGEFFSAFSFIKLFLFIILFLFIFYIIFDEGRKTKIVTFIYNYRLLLAFLVLIVAIIFQIHGSSINELNIFNVNHNPLIGISRQVRTDEYSINTLFAFSQYMNGFSYFSDIFRGTLTDMFIVYGQPVLDVGMIFRPFLIGYLFLNQGQGLSFFWIGRLIFLLLISFEFGMLLTNKNKILSFSYALLITFSPIIQWWFAINGLVEQLIFGQLGILLLNWYMTINDYKKRFLIALGLMVCIGGFALVFYPSWQIPFAYVFVSLAIWILIKHALNFQFTKKDIFIILSCGIIFLILMAHILSNSLETIQLVLNTIYPGSEVFNGGGKLNSFIYYISSIFFPIDQINLSGNVCEYGVFIDLFPIPLILSFIVLFYQKTKDNLLLGLLGLYLILIMFYFLPLPDVIIDVTLRSHIRTHRLIPVISFVSVMILIRSMCSLKEFKNKKLFILGSLILSIIMVYLSLSEFNSYYLYWMPVFAMIFYFILFSLSFLASSETHQRYFLIAIVILSLFTGVLVNPIDTGTDVIFESNFAHEVEKIVADDPDGLWIVQGMGMNNIIPYGAKTFNAEQTYPDFETWHKLDVNKQYEDVYNRYAHVFVELQENNDTFFELEKPNAFTVHLNTNDLEKMNVNYILTRDNLDNLSNTDVQFEKIYQEANYMIYRVKY